MEVRVERRKHKRFQVYVPGHAYDRLSSATLGQIIDIGNGGLSFRYIASKKLPYTSLELDIVLPNRVSYLKKLPSRIMSDSAIDGETSISSRAGTTTRRCGVQFGDLTDDQRVDLNYFIHAYTIGPIAV